MTQFHEETILLSNLGLDSRNPRHKFLESQREIIEWMVSGIGRIGDKLLVLAKDIVQNGLNPAERVMVLKDEKKDKQFLVLEGNRRVTALKLLNNPDTAPTKEWQNRFAKLANQGYSRVIAKEELTQIKCPAQGSAGEEKSDANQANQGL